MCFTFHHIRPLSLVIGSGYIGSFHGVMFSWGQNQYLHQESVSSKMLAAQHLGVCLLYVLFLIHSQGRGQTNLDSLEVIDGK